MIDTQTETVLTLAQAARWIPGRNGQGVHVSTTWRWTLRGIRGVLLETILIGGIRYTSQEALQRFFEATTAAADGTPVPARTTKRREKAIEAAERELRSAGI
jgi:hypothetical protein